MFAQAQSHFIPCFPTTAHINFMEPHQKYSSAFQVNCNLGYTNCVTIILKNIYCDEKPLRNNISTSNIKYGIKQEKF